MDQTLVPPFTVTHAAIDEIERLGGHVRVELADGGCCGTAYAFTVPDTEDQDPPDHHRYGCEGAWLTVSKGASAVLDGATLDYASRLRPPRFRVIRNPNTEHVCACRRSFGAPWPGAGSSHCRSYLPMPWDTTFDPPASWKRQTGYRG